MGQRSSRIPDLDAECVLMRRILVIAVVATCLVGVAGPAGGGRVRVKAAGDTGSWHWEPDFRHIVKGTVVVWKNPTSATHRVTAYTNNWTKDTSVPAGESTRKRFKQPGAYGYRCSIPGHSSVSGGECSGMCGEIHVTRN